MATNAVLFVFSTTFPGVSSDSNTHPCCCSMCAQFSSKLVVSKLQNMHTPRPMRGGGKSSSSPPSSSCPSSDCTSISSSFPPPTLSLLLDEVFADSFVGATCAVSAVDGSAATVTPPSPLIAAAPVVDEGIAGGGGFCIVVVLVAGSAVAFAALALTASLCFLDSRCCL